MPPCAMCSRSASVLIACDGIGCGAYQTCLLGDGTAGVRLQYCL